jgi:hypothetical protein
VALLILAGALLCLLGMRLAFPQFTESSIKAADGVANKVLERVAGMAPPAGSGLSTAQQAHFTALDGTVRVKKGSSSSWLAADYNVPLDKGDVVQTGIGRHGEGGVQRRHQLHRETGFADCD